MIPSIVEKTINILFESLEEHKVTDISFYLYGSIALNDYIEGTSDIDFIAILPQTLTDEQIEGIRASHLYLEKLLPHTDIMGSYILQDDLGKNYDDINFVLTYSNKELFISGGQPDINPITWWMLKHYGVHVYGPIVEMEFEIEKTTVLSYVHANINTYWAGWIGRLEAEAGELSLLDAEVVSKHLDSAVEWCTLGMLRQLYTVSEISIKSKVAAGIYGLSVVPEQWHSLIKEAISIKKLEPKRLYSSNETRCHDLIALLTYLKAEVNRIYDEHFIAIN